MRYQQKEFKYRQCCSLILYFQYSFFFLIACFPVFSFLLDEFNRVSCHLSALSGCTPGQSCFALPFIKKAHKLNTNFLKNTDIWDIVAYWCCTIVCCQIRVLFFFFAALGAHIKSCLVYNKAKDGFSIKPKCMSRVILFISVIVFNLAISAPSPATCVWQKCFFQKGIQTWFEDIKPWYHIYWGRSDHEERYKVHSWTSVLAYLLCDVLDGQHESTAGNRKRIAFTIRNLATSNSLWCAS